jgi:ubiquinone/menaquinone biosynthesis C-methylase UbiE
MKNTGIRIEDSYLKHIEDEKTRSTSGELPKCYTHPDSIETWRHDRMRNNLLPLIHYFPDAQWITIGDGSYGSDAYYLQNRGLSVLATSISDETISVAHNLGYIKKYKAVNAEDIAEENNSFDFVLCKEAYHHFPRPPVAFYEMLRVAKNAVVLIEPQESRVSFLGFIKKTIKKLIRKDISFNYESTGNFIFRINIKEIIKMMVALNLSYIAYKKFNDFYFPSFSTNSKKGLSIAKIITDSGIIFQNILCRIGLLDYGLSVIIIFKTEPDVGLIKTLTKKGFKLKKLPKNPYDHS